MHPNTLEVPWCFNGQVGQALIWLLLCEISCVRDTYQQHLCIFFASEA